MTPKSLLRHKLAVSPIKDFTDGRFSEVLDDGNMDANQVRRVVFCSGKVYYDLLEKRAGRAAEEVALVRVEQFYPFAEEPIRKVLARYRKAREWVWAQEESQNMGGWTFMEPRLRALGQEFAYVGRDASASPATGSLRVHRREQEELVMAALEGEVPHVVQAIPPTGSGIIARPTDKTPAAEKTKVS
jgi:2-oxoglutarate dehydrogenase E1 component